MVEVTVSRFELSEPINGGGSGGAGGNGPS